MCCALGRSAAARLREKSQAVSLLRFATAPLYELEGLVPARAWGFKSPLRHQATPRSEA
jgi:hypothetical protein